MHTARRKGNKKKTKTHLLRLHSILHIEVSAVRAALLEPLIAPVLPAVRAVVGENAVDRRGALEGSAQSDLAAASRPALGGVVQVPLRARQSVVPMPVAVVQRDGEAMRKRFASRRDSHRAVRVRDVDRERVHVRHLLVALLLVANFLVVEALLLVLVPVSVRYGNHPIRHLSLPVDDLWRGGREGAV